MDRLLLKGVLHDGRVRNILIEDKRFKDLDAPAEVAEAQVFDASGSAILPAMYNTHTHAAMTLLRGYADDMPEVAAGVYMAVRGQTYPRGYPER